MKLEFFLEMKQDDLRKNRIPQKVKFFIGDVRDVDSIKPAILGVNYIFHVAALTSTPHASFFP